jgi:acetyl-CoA carboxylase biotin carboxyl carrier protein
VVAVVRASDVTELEVANGEFSVRVRRETASVAATNGAIDGATAGPTQEQTDAHLHRVVAPFTGVFYRSPTPAAGAYVDEGEWVDGDVVVGLVETMKIFNEIKADVAGRVVRFTAESGQLVHTGDPLLLLEPGERAPAEAEQRV